MTVPWDYGANAHLPCQLGEASYPLCTQLFAYKMETWPAGGGGAAAKFWVKRECQGLG